MTNAQLVLNKIQETLCHEGTTYKGKSGTYMYIVGRPTINDTINGVVHKLNETGEQDLLDLLQKQLWQSLVRYNLYNLYNQNHLMM